MITKYKIFEIKWYNKGSFVEEEEDDEVEVIEDQFKRGDLVIRPNRPPQHDNLMIITKDVGPDDSQVQMFFCGGIDWNYDRTIKYASFIFNTDKARIVKIFNNGRPFRDDFVSFRRLNEEERELVRQRLMSSKDERYLNVVYEKTGLRINI